MDNLHRNILHINKINKPMFEIYNFIIKHPDTDVRTIYLKLKKDRTTVQKILNKLERNNLIKKYKKNMSRGFKYIFKIENEKKLYINTREELIKMIDELNKKILT